MNRIRVLIVDDSALARTVLRRTLSTDPAIDVVGAAHDPVMALERIQRLQPDLLTLDLEMPHMDGITFLDKLMRSQPMPVIVVSNHVAVGSPRRGQALAAGAVAVFEAPALDPPDPVEIARLLAAIHRAAHSRVAGRAASDAGTPPPLHATRLIAIGASTGGTDALATLIDALPADAPGTVIVQHMTAAFTGSFAASLDRRGIVQVREASAGMRIEPGLVLLAPGNQHLRIVRQGTELFVETTAEPPVNHHRPSIDVLFHSCATAAGATALGVLLTGMGADGADGLAAMRGAGAETIAQDEETSVVFGLPREAIARGAAGRVLGLSAIGAVLSELGRPVRAA